MSKGVKISDEAKAFILIKALYHQGVINQETFNAISERYMFKGDSNEPGENYKKEF